MASQSAGIWVRLSNQYPGVYNQVVVSFALAILLSFLVPSPGFAAGSGEGEPASSPATGATETRVRAFILAEAENDGNRMYTERVAIPEAASLTRWTRFSRAGREVKMESAVTLSLRDKRMIAQSLSSGVIVQTFELVAAGRAEPGSAKTPCPCRGVVLRERLPHQAGQGTLPARADGRDARGPAGQQGNRRSPAPRDHRSRPREILRCRGAALRASRG